MERCRNGQRREAFCCLPGSSYSKFKTDKGLPQGSLLSQILFCLFLIDIFTRVESEKIKFADDGTIYGGQEPLTTLIQDLEKDLKKKVEWTKKWRMKKNIDKTEFCVFLFKVRIHLTTLIVL